MVSLLFSNLYLAMIAHICAILFTLYSIKICSNIAKMLQYYRLRCNIVGIIYCNILGTKFSFGDSYLNELIVDVIYFDI